MLKRLKFKRKKKKVITRNENIRKAFCNNLYKKRSWKRPQRSLNKFKTSEILSSIFSKNNSEKLEINKKTGKKANTWQLNNILANNQWGNKDIKNTLRQIKCWKLRLTMGHSKNNFKTEVYSDIGKVTRMKEITKIRVEIKKQRPKK